MNCSNCTNGTTQDATYLCHTNDYRIVDSNGNLLVKVADHDFDSENPEIGDSCEVIYCDCGEYWSE